MIINYKNDVNNDYAYKDNNKNHDDDDNLGKSILLLTFHKQSKSLCIIKHKLLLVTITTLNHIHLLPC
jgi:hypothetical protein